MNVKMALYGVALFASLVQVALGQTTCLSCCYNRVPTSVSPVEDPYNSEDPHCWSVPQGANVDCSGQITKTVHYYFTFPNVIQQQSMTVVAYGGSDSDNTCVDGDRVVGPPYYHVLCWPDFYAPVPSDGQLEVDTYDKQVAFLQDICGLYGIEKFNMACGTYPVMEHIALDPCSYGQ
jgi:hypothetical protein